MSNVKVTLKDGSVKEFAAGTSYMEIAKSNLKQFFGIYAAKIGCVPKLEFVK